MLLAVKPLRPHRPGIASSRIGRLGSGYYGRHSTAGHCGGTGRHPLRGLLRHCPMLLGGRKGLDQQKLHGLDPLGDHFA